MSDNQLLERYFEIVEAKGLFSSRANLRFYLEYLFKDVHLKDSTILDVGGGSGLFSFYAACNGARSVICLEPEADGSSSGVTSLFYEIQDALQLKDKVIQMSSPLLNYEGKEHAFDVILLHNSINHLDEPACMKLLEDPSAEKTYSTIFQRLAALTNPGGRVIIADCSRYNAFATLGVKNPFVPQIEWEKHQAPETWAQLLCETGFSNPRIRWTSFNRLGPAGRTFLGNRLAAYFGMSHFCLTAKRA